MHVFAQEVDRDYLAAVDNIIIKQEWVEAAIDAHVKLNIRPGVERVAGQDIADGGGDKNALAIRHGIILRHCDHWAGEAGDAPGIGRPVMIEQGVRELFYDSVGVGAGYKTGVNNLKNQGTWPQSIAVYPWSGAGEVLDPTQPIIPGDPDSPKNEDQYANLKAQSWFRLRTRFIKTFRAVRHGEKFEPVELISLDSRMPRLHELKSELSQAVHKVSGTGKTLVDKCPEQALDRQTWQTPLLSATIPILRPVAFSARSLWAYSPFPENLNLRPSQDQPDISARTWIRIWRMRFVWPRPRSARRYFRA